MRAPARLRHLVGAVGLLSLTACLTGAPAGFEVTYVQHAPPRRIVEFVGVSPGRGYVWVPGQYAWRSGTYIWIGGRYVLPARGYRTYVPGQWRHSRRGWYWVDGRWR